LVRGRGNVAFVGACILVPGYVDVQGADTISVGLDIRVDELDDAAHVGFDAD
jgi:hypothetical protein